VKVCLFFTFSASRQRINALIDDAKFSACVSFKYAKLTNCTPEKKMLVDFLKTSSPDHPDEKCLQT